MSTMSATTRWTSALFTADDVACTATRHTKGEEETAHLPTLVIPRRGVFAWRSGSATVIAEPNTVLLFDPAQPHRITHLTDDGDDCTALRFSPELVDDALGELQRSERHWMLDANAQFELHVTIQRIRRATDVLESEEAALQILRMLSGAQMRRDVPHRAVNLVRERIAAEPGERATLADLAHGTGLSASELARRFRASTGSSIHQYRLRLRLLVALSRVNDGEDDLTTLALELGFASHAHFTATFTRSLHAPPRAFRALAGSVQRRD